MQRTSEAAPAFNPVLRGTDEGAWRAALGNEPAWQPRAGPVVIVSPHPDDEVLGAGGLIRVWSERGYPVIVVSVTDGEAAFSDWLDLRAIRRRELDRALFALTTRSVRIIRLRLPDGGVVRSLSALEGELRTLCESLEGTGATLVAPFEHDGHPDHEAAATACLEAARNFDLPIARYPIWAWHHAEPSSLENARWGRFELNTEAQIAKRAAIRCFSSQILSSERREPIIPAHVLDYFERDYEAFLL